MLVGGGTITREETSEQLGKKKSWGAKSQVGISVEKLLKEQCQFREQ